MFGFRDGSYYVTKREDELLSVLDILDIDESAIDSCVKYITQRTSFSNKHLVNCIQLLKYKQLINIRENVDCDNTHEFEFVCKLLASLDNETIDNICRITSLTLSLDRSTLTQKAEHLIQQILADLYLPSETADNDDTKLSDTLLCLKVCDSVLNVIIELKGQLSLPFLATPLENILYSKYEDLNTYFLTNTIPHFFKAIHGYNIVDRIWEFILKSNYRRDYMLKVICSLSDFYLPVENEGRDVTVSSELVKHLEFWELVLYGFGCNNSSLPVQKMSIYLIKRSLDCLRGFKNEVKIDSPTVTFYWNPTKGDEIKKIWHIFFILMDSLGEKQSNIVLPSLRLFASIKELGHCWVNSAYNIGLRHDNARVRFKCIEYRLELEISSESEAIVLLEALNDTNLYDIPAELDILMQKIAILFKENKKQSILYVLKTMPQVKWSPVPFFHLSNIFANLNITDLFADEVNVNGANIVADILKIQCNSVLIRKAVHINMTYFLSNCGTTFNWKNYLELFLLLQPDAIWSGNDYRSPVISWVKYIKINDEENGNFYDALISHHESIIFGKLYMAIFANGSEFFPEIAEQMIMKLKNAKKTPDRPLLQYIEEAKYLLQLFMHTDSNWQSHKENTVIANEYISILKYVSEVLLNDPILNLDNMVLICKGLECLSRNLYNVEASETLLKLYQTCSENILDTEIDFYRKLFCLYILQILLNDIILQVKHKEDKCNLASFVKLISSLQIEEIINSDSSGKLRNMWFEKTVEIIYSLRKQYSEIVDKREVIEYVLNVGEYGGYGCVKWVLRIINLLLPIIINDDQSRFDVTRFLNKMWVEIEELKSNNQYNESVKEFVNVLTNDELLKKPLYNNIVVMYCEKIIQVGALKSAPLYFLVKTLNERDVSQYSQLIFVLRELLLFSVVPRKDQRIAENLTMDILNDPKYALNKTELETHFYFEIKYQVVSILSRIQDPEILSQIITLITGKIEDQIKNKQRYHENSYIHRSLLATLQHMLLIILKSRQFNIKTSADWCMNMLGKLPHHSSVKIYLEWYISLYFYIDNVKLNEELLLFLKPYSISLTSLFIVIYWVVCRRLSAGTQNKEEYEFTMDFLLSHTMGPMFNVRLYAQYLATRLYEVNENSPKNIDTNKYDNIIHVIRNTLAEAEKAKDKNFTRIQGDFFVHAFDIVDDLTPSRIYHILLMFMETVSNENVNECYIDDILSKIEESVSVDCDDFAKEWAKRRKFYDIVYKGERARRGNNELTTDEKQVGTIQKKYVPWKQMSDIEICEMGDKNTKASDLIVVATLIDKVPNLGGMARTSEVFGVKKYVINSFRYLSDKQFQGLSVSAERWVDVEEVRERVLRDYLLNMKSQGYCVVAAEQTSNSLKLQDFKFPRKTLLLLGHEKHGIPCDLLPYMDYCVEIPQQGVVRSLNVHVSASLFIWEYTRQNVL